jgi:predicted nucleic acid-binding protein
VIFIDSNIPMYLVGAPHPNQAAALAALEQIIRRNERMVTSAEVLQEILHRYTRINRLDAIQPALDALLGLTDEVFPIETDDVHGAHAVLRRAPQISAREALHVAVMQRREVPRILSYDRGFDVIATIERVS